MIKDYRNLSFYHGSEMEITMLLKTRLLKIKTWLAVGYFDMMFCMHEKRKF